MFYFPFILHGNSYQQYRLICTQCNLIFCLHYLFICLHIYLFIYLFIIYLTGIDSSSTACIVSSMCHQVCQAVKNGDQQVLEDARRIVNDK